MTTELFNIWNLAALYVFISIIAELCTFHAYINGEVNYCDEEVVEKQIMCWGWPFFLLLDIVLFVVYGTIAIPYLLITNEFNRNE